MPPGDAGAGPSPDVHALDADVVTALHYDEPAIAPELAAWCGGQLQHDDDGVAPPTIWVPTAGGPRPAALGDWIVQHAGGGFRAYEDAAFRSRHEPLR